MSNLTGDDGSFSSTNTGDQLSELKSSFHAGNTSLPPAKKKRNLPGTPDPTAEVIALSPSSLTATNRFVCEICNKGFQRDQNLQLHRRGHNLPWKLKQRTNSDTKKRVYICPELSCVHHNPARALGDLTGIKKHYSRKHGEKKWKCDRCLKKYAVQSDWKAHLKTCGTREYKCDCGTIFSRKDSFITHRAFCDALTEENNKVNQGMLQSQRIPDDYTPCMQMNIRNTMSMGLPEFKNSPLILHPQDIPMLYGPINTPFGLFSSGSDALLNNPSGVSSSTSGLELSSSNGPVGYGNFQQDNETGGLLCGPTTHMSATALLQNAAEIDATASNIINSPIIQKSYVTSMAGPYQPSSDGRRPTSSYFNIQGPFHNIQTQPEENNALQNPIQQDTFGPGPGPKPVLNAYPVITDIGTYSEILGGGDQSLGSMNMDHGDGINSNTDIANRIGDPGFERHVSGSNGDGGGSNANDALIVDVFGSN